MIELNALTRQQAADNIEALAEDNRLVQGMWQREDVAGRRIACLLGAIHPDIHGDDACPAHIMPSWIAATIPMLFDGIRYTEVGRYGKAFASALRNFDPDRTPYQDFLREFAIRSFALAAPLNSNRATDYWPAIASSCDRVIKLLSDHALISELEDARDSALASGLNRLSIWETRIIPAELSAYWAAHVCASAADGLADHFEQDRASLIKIVSQSIAVFSAAHGLNRDDVTLLAHEFVFDTMLDVLSGRTRSPER